MRGSEMQVFDGMETSALAIAAGRAPAHIGVPVRDREKPHHEKVWRYEFPDPQGGSGVPGGGGREGYSLPGAEGSVREQQTYAFFSGPSARTLRYSPDLFPSPYGPFPGEPVPYPEPHGPYPHGPVPLRPYPPNPAPFPGGPAPGPCPGCPYRPFGGPHIYYGSES